MRTSRLRKNPHPAFTTRPRNKLNPTLHLLANPFIDSKTSAKHKTKKPRPRNVKRRAKREGGSEPHSTKFIVAWDAQIQKLKEAEEISKQRSLVLPAAQVGEAELEEIAKIGQAGQSARELMNDKGEGNEASGRLLGQYEGLGHVRMGQTPRTAPQEDNIMAEARNLRNMVQAQTPLLGEENTPMHVSSQGGTRFERATPRHQVAFTPNLLATPRSNGSEVSGDRVGATPLRTLMRDSLNINPEGGTPRIGNTPREEQMRAAATQRSLELGFESLPKPRNDFEVVLPEDEEEAEEVDKRTITVKDMAERNAGMKKLQEEEEHKALERRSSVVKRSLPRTVHLSRWCPVGGANFDWCTIPPRTHPLARLSPETPWMYDIPDDEDVATAALSMNAGLSVALRVVFASPEEVRKGVVLAA
ncbi:pre-mRNA-splicing factor CEF1 [Ceratobasidium sp. AG-Ba]|nr:pre-mRNA-splicing factor CEF1 [Ceratobasidium sp. AG-Ba]